MIFCKNDFVIFLVICSLETNMRTEVDWRHENRLETKIVFSNQSNVIGNKNPDFETINLDWKHIPFENILHLFVDTKVKIELYVSNLNDFFN